MNSSNDNHSQPSFYAIIPAEVRYCKKLEPSAKLLYGEITALSNKEGYSWSSNEYFANLYDVDISTIKRWLDSLEKNGFIKREIKKEGMKTSRKIWISNKLYEGSKMSQSRSQNQDARGLENEPYNNTSINNTTTTENSSGKADKPPVVVVEKEKKKPTESKPDTPLTEEQQKQLERMEKICNERNIQMSQKQMKSLVKNYTREELRKAFSLHFKQHEGQGKIMTQYPYKWFVKCMDEKWYE